MAHAQGSLRARPSAVEVLAPASSSGPPLPAQPRRVLLHRARVVSTDEATGECNVVLRESGLETRLRVDECVAWESYATCLTSSSSFAADDDGSTEAIAVYRSEMLGEGLFSCLFWALGFLELEARVGTITKLGRKPDRCLIDWTDERLLFHGGTPANAWDAFFEPPPLGDGGGGGGGGGPAASPALIERAAAAGTLGVTTMCGPPYFCKLGNFRGGEPRNFMALRCGRGDDRDDVPGGRQADLDGGGGEHDLDDQLDGMGGGGGRWRRARSEMPRQLEERDWGGPLDAATIEEGRDAFARWVVVRSAIRAAADAAFDRLCGRRLPAREWLAVHVRQTDKLSEGRVWHFELAAIVAQVLERAAGLRCRGAFVASDDPALKRALEERLAASGLCVASWEATLSQTPGAAAHKDASIDRHRNAQDCLIEVLLMARMRGLVCTLSNVSTAAIFFARPGYRHYLFTQSSHAAHDELSDSELSMF